MKTSHHSHWKATVLLGMLALLATCKGYEEGPAISLRGMEKRIIGYWRIDSYSVDGADSMQIVKNLRLQGRWYFLSGQGFSEPYLRVVTNENDTVHSFGGRWIPRDKGKKVGMFLDYQDALVNGQTTRPFNIDTRPVIPSNNLSWTILRLTHREDMWLRLDRNGKRYELKFKSI